MKKITALLIGLITVLFLVYLFCQFSQVVSASASYSSQKWRESRGLVSIWKRVKKEKVESIVFYAPDANEIISHCNGYAELPYDHSFRWRDDNDIKTWQVEFSIPKAHLDESIRLIDKGVKEGVGYHLIPFERMLIVTNKGKYITWVQTELKSPDRPGVFAQDWGSYELGRFIAKYCVPDSNYKYVLPPKEKVVTILLYPPVKSPPLALFGDKKIAEKLIFEPNVKDDPNGIIGISDLYKFGRICQFGVETRKEDHKYVWENEIKPQKTFEGREWLEKIMDAFEIGLKEAKQNDKYYPGTPDSFNARIVFMTLNGDIWKEIGISKNAVYDDYIKSEQLKKYFDELGLTKELEKSK